MSDGSSQNAFRILGLKVFSKCDTKIKKCLREDVLYLLRDDYEKFYCDVHRLRYEGGISVIFFIILAAGMAFCAAYVQQVADVKDMLVAISGVLSGPLGFIIGYYFKASKE